MLVHLASTMLVAMLVSAGLPAAAAEGVPPLQGGREVVVFAAASLTEAFTEIAHAFEALQPGTEVTLNFGGSQQLAAQILEAAPADVFASASAEQMKRVVKAKLLRDTPKVFATNLLTIAVAPGNPKHIGRLEDLSHADLVMVMAAEEVPAGKYARVALKKARVTVNPKSFETDVRSVLAKVALGEADAGIVYASDVISAAQSVSSVAIPSAQNVVASYPIAVVNHGSQNEAASEFVSFVLSGSGRTILGRFGFGPPERR